MNSLLTERVILSGVPIDCFKVNDLETILLDLLKLNNNSQIVFLTYQKFLQAKYNKEYLDTLSEAALIIPVDRALVWAVSRVLQKVAYCFDPYDFILNMLIAYENSKQSVYLMGGKRHSLQKAYQKLKDSFKGLLFVGRHVGNVRKEDGHLILETIRKASPSVIIFSNGIKGRERWVSKTYQQFSQSICVYYEPFFNIINGRIQHEVIRYQDKKTGENLYGGLNNINAFNFFQYLYFVLVILFTKRVKRSSKNV